MTIEVVREQRGLMRHEIRIGRHTLTADLGVEAGGEGAGPTPHDLYDAALGACKALTVLLYARRRKLPLQGITVSVDRDASEERAGVYRLTATLSLTGDLSAQHREDLLRVAKKCPIEKLMTEVTTEISTRLSP